MRWSCFVESSLRSSSVQVNMETMGKAICLMVLLFCAAASPGHAEMYSYVDGQGKRCYTNAPTSGNSQIHESQEVVIRKPGSQPWPEARLFSRREFWF
ncbi:MAG: DUF4124 domain-containing protein [Chlorobium sp.]|nr:DUF4124 domain-containing protein [Chlorobium sp.]